MVLNNLVIFLNAYQEELLHLRWTKRNWSIEKKSNYNHIKDNKTFLFYFFLDEALKQNIYEFQIQINNKNIHTTKITSNIKQKKSALAIRWKQSNKEKRIGKRKDLGERKMNYHK